MQRPGFDSWVGKIPYRRKWQPTPVFLPGESHGQRSLVGYSPWCPKSRTRLSDFHYYYQRTKNRITISLVHTVVSDSLWRHGLQHARPPYPSPTHRVYSHSCPFSWWCHPTISTSVIPLSSCPQSFPASGSLQMNQLFTSGGQSIGVSASASVLPMNTQD